MSTAATPAQQFVAPRIHATRRFNLLAYFRSIWRALIGEVLCLTAGELR